MVKLVRIGSQTYFWPARAQGLLSSVRSVLEEEEQRALELLPYLHGTPEHLLIHQVQMYLFRFAVPAAEIESGDISKINLERMRQRLWLCMIGRALDDLVDGDSKFFTAGASAILLVAYAEQLAKSGAGGDFPALALAAREIVPTSSQVLTFTNLEVDICARVAYFLTPTDVQYPDKAPLLRGFLTLMLGRCDLNDAVADSGRASTLLSRSLRLRLADDEGKLQLGPQLFAWYAEVASVLVAGGGDVLDRLTDVGAEYAASIMRDEMDNIGDAVVSVRAGGLRKDRNSA